MTIQAIALTPVSDPVAPELPLLDALRRMLRLELNHLPVCDAEGRWLGLLGMDDLVGQVLPVSARIEHGLDDLSFVGDATRLLVAHLLELKDKRVEEAMHADLPRLAPDARLMEAALLLYRHPHPLPVVAADGRLLGMLSRRALMDYLLRKGEGA